MLKKLLGCGFAVAVLCMVGCGSSGSGTGGTRAYDVTHGGTGAYAYYTWTDLLAGQTTVAGRVGVKHDGQYIWVTYETTGGWVLNGTHLDIEPSAANFPQTKTGNPKPGQFRFKRTYLPPVTTDTYQILLTDLGSWAVLGRTICIAAHADLSLLDGTGAVVRTETGWGNGTGFPGANWSMYFCYELTQAPPPPVVTIQAGDFTTYTQGGWGSPSNSVPGAYRDAHFAATFPSGLVVGCSTGSLSFTSASAVEAFLPQGGPAKVLPPGNLANPLQDWFDAPPPGGNLTGNVLAGQTVALTLNVGFDLSDPAFSLSPVNLKNLVVTGSGPFAGWTVQAVLNEVNAVLGGCSTAHTPAEANTMADAINNNFDNGIENDGVLALP